MVAEADLALVFKALGDPTRLRILELLKAKGNSCCELVSKKEPGLCACDVERAVGLSQAAVSYHLDWLKRAGLVSTEKRGRWVYYRRDEEALASVARTLVNAV